MRTFDWYLIFSLPDFLATGLVSRTETVYLDGVSQKDILITKGNTVAMTFEDTFLPIEFADKNPYIRTPYAVYVDAEGGVWLGIEVEE